MLYFNTTKQNIIDAVSKKVFWAFDIEVTGSALSFSDEGGMSFSDEGGISFVGTETYYWSTVSRSWNGNTYEFKIIPESFNGVVLNRNKSELGLHSPNILEFDIVNTNNTIEKLTFEGAHLTLKLVVSDYTNERVIRQWEFIIKRVDPDRQKLHFYCEDYIYRYLKGDYPNTELVRNIFPVSNSVTNDNVCIPEPYGTAYIPIRSVYDNNHTVYTSTSISVQASSNGANCKILDTSSGLNVFEIGRTATISGFTSTANNQSAIILNKSATQLDFSQSEGFVTEALGDSVTITQGSRTYLLGSTTYTFTINKVRSPRDWGKKSEWSSTAYTFTQAIKTDPSTNNWRTFQPIINDVNNDGTADAPGYWQQGEVFLDMPTQFMRSDSSSLTNPADVIKTVLNNIGVSSTRLKLDNGLITYWSFNEGTSGTTSITDGSTGNLTLQVYNNPGWTTGISGNAISITSSSHYGYSTGITTLPSSQVSISLWFKRTGGGSSQVQQLITHDYGTTDGTWRVYNTTASISFAIKSSSGFIVSTKSTDITTTGWHHVVGIYDGSNAKLFFDGSSATISSSKAVALQSTGTIRVNSSSYIALANIDEIRIYNRALSSTEVDELYNNPPMRGWWSHARDTYNTWNLQFNGAFWYKEKREFKLSKLLNMCHSVLNIEDKIELRPLIKTSQFTVDNSHILTNGSETEPTSFKYNNVLTDEYSDCGYITWQQSGQSQDRFLQLLVGAKNDTKTKISNQILEIPFVQDSQQAQVIGILYYQRLLLRKAMLSFMAKSQLICLQPDDVITINYGDYGGTYNVLIENIRIKRNLSIQIDCVMFSGTLDDWDDLSPSAIVVSEDDTTAKVWQPAIVGSLSDQDIGKQLWAKSYLVVGQNTNQGDYTNIQSAINALDGSNYSGIYIKRGTYSITSVYFPSTVPVNIIGENKDNTIISLTTGTNGFVFHNCKQFYNLSNFKIISNDSSSQTSFSSLVSLTSSTGNFSFEDIVFSNMKINAASTTPVYGNIGMLISDISGDVNINNCDLDGGIYSLSITNTNNFSITNNIINDALTNIYIVSGGSSIYNLNGSIQFNKFNNYRYRGVYTNYCNKFDISFNNFNFTTSTQINGLVLGGPEGINVNNTKNLKVIGNIIDLNVNSTVNLPNENIQGIRVANLLTKSNVSNNNINIYRKSTGSSGISYGINGRFQDCQISSNTIKINSNTTKNYRYGVSVSGTTAITQGRNIIQANNIDCTNNNAFDIGIFLSNDLNQGGDNITYNVGVSISDAGSSNAVTAKDI